MALAHSYGPLWNPKKDRSLIRKLTQVFNNVFQQRMEKEKDGTSAFEDAADEIFSGGFGYQQYQSQMLTEERSKAEKLDLYRQMEAYDEINQAIETICDYAINQNEDDETAKLVIKRQDLIDNVNIKDNLQKEWNYIKNEVLHLEDNAWHWLFSFIVTGELFLEKIINSKDPKKGVRRIKKLFTDTTFPVWDDDKVIGFTSKDLKRDEMVLLSPAMIAYSNFGKYQYNMETGEKIVLSYLETAKKSWRQLVWVEDAIIIYRVTRAPERRVFNIATGNMPKGKAEGYMKRLMKEYQQRLTYDQKTGMIGGQTHIQHMLSDFWFARPNDSEGSSVDTLAAGCLPLDTRIPLLDGRTLELGEIINEYKQGKENWVYSCNPENGEIVPGPITDAGITNKNAKVMKLTFDNGETQICTLNHKWPVWGKGKVEAKELEIGDSLIPFNRRRGKIKSSGCEYEEIFDNKDKKWKWTHRVVAEYLRETDLYQEKYFDSKHNKPLDTVHHYELGNHFNNNPNNIFWMAHIDHFNFHNSLMKSIHANRTPEKKKEIYSKVAKGIRDYVANLSSEEREIRAINSRNAFKKATEAINKIIMSGSKKGLDMLKRRNEAIRKARSTVKEKTRMSDFSKNMWKTPGHYEKAIGPQTICFSSILLKYVVDTCKEKDITKYRVLLSELNNDLKFMDLFKSENKTVKRIKSFGHHHLKKMLDIHGYEGWRDFVSKLGLFNHKIVKIEYLEKTVVVGNLTVDGEEKYHGFHTYALESGVFTSNSNLGELEDLEYFLKKMYRALKIPEAMRFDAESRYNTGRVGDTTYQEVKFQKMCNRIMQKFIYIVWDVYKTHLELNGMWKKYKLTDEDLKVKFHANNLFEEMRDADVNNARLDQFGTVSSYIGEVFSKKTVMRKYLRMSEEEIDQNNAEMEKEKREGGGDMDSGMGGMGGGF